MSRMVTRRFTLTSCRILSMNTEDRTVTETTVEVAGKFKSMSKLTDAIRKTYDNKEHIFVSLINAEILRRLKGVDEAIFLANSVDVAERKSNKNV